MDVVVANRPGFANQNELICEFIVAYEVPVCEGTICFGLSKLRVVNVVYLIRGDMRLEINVCVRAGPGIIRVVQENVDSQVLFLNVTSDQYRMSTIYMGPCTVQ
jgi:hypothetical protein